MALLRKNNGNGLTRLRSNFDKFFDDDFFSTNILDTPVLKTKDILVDIADNGDSLLVTASVPGVPKDNLHIEVDETSVRVWGEVEEDTERKEEDYHVRERSYGRVERWVSLPDAVNADDAVANYDNGVLKLTLPKNENAKRKEIKITDT